MIGQSLHQPGMQLTNTVQGQGRTMTSEIDVGQTATDTDHHPVTIASSLQPRGSVTAAFFLFLMSAGALGSLAVTLIYNHTTLSVVEVIAVFILLSFLINLFRGKYHAPLQTS